MLSIIDFHVDDADDITLLGDIAYEYDASINTIITSQRRISAKQGDFILSNIGVGAEKYINSHLNNGVQYLLQADILRSLVANSLFDFGEFSVVILSMIEEHKLPVLIKLRTSNPRYTSFKTIINTQNQRSYK